MLKQLLATTAITAIALSGTITATAHKAPSTDLSAYSGGYLWTSVYYEEGAGSITHGGKLTKITDTEVKLEGFCTASLPITGTLVGDTIFIQPQIASNASSFGPLALKRFYFTGYRMKPDDKPIRVVLENGKIKFCDYTGLVVDSGTYEGVPATDTFSPFEADRANGSMHITYNRALTSDSYPDADIPVIITQTDSTVSVKNFADLGDINVNINLSANGTIIIPKQAVHEQTQTGIFYTFAASYPEGATSFLSSMVTDDNITGTWSPEQLQWGNWIIANESLTLRMGCPESATVRYVDGTQFVYHGGVNTVELNEVSRIIYHNLSGLTSDAPFDGLNIVETIYTDGSRFVTKQIIKK